jgi:hypothetical protein
MKKSILVLLGAFFVAGCASEYDQCVSRAYSDVRSIQAGIATSEGNLSRGYAIHVSQEPYTEFETCYDSSNNPYSCPKTYYRTVETPVAIDASLEKSNLSRLKARLQPAERLYRREVKSCEGLEGS